MKVESVFRFCLLLYLYGNIKGVEECPLGQYHDGRRCISCFSEAYGRQKCRWHLCTNAYPVKRCEDGCSYYCIDEMCPTFARTCIRGCAKGWYGHKCDIKCSERCLNNTCDRDGSCTCTIGYFGLQCSNSCPRNCNGEGCDYNDGKCIYGCKAFWYGDRCDKECVDDCQDSLCHQRNGSCLKGCKISSCGNRFYRQCLDNCVDINCLDGTCNVCNPGYRGSSCSIICPPNCVDCHQYDSKCTTCRRGKYGSICEKSCNNCKLDRCDKDGICIEGCRENYHGPKCDECQPGFYGHNCEFSCSSRCNNSVCDKTAGTCTQGCSNSFYGLFCHNTCNTGCVDRKCDHENGVCTAGCENIYFGTHCNHSCSTGCADGNCNQTTGACTHGCNSAYYGVYCNHTCSTRCADGNCNQTTGACTHGCSSDYYGVYCNHTCSSRCANEICNQTIGACTHECNSTYYEVYCIHSCSVGCAKGECNQTTNVCIHGCNSTYYGVYCNHTCSVGCAGGTCNQTTGACTHGCRTTYYGVYCNHTCSNTCSGSLCQMGEMENATCISGCEDGWWGSYCQHKCPDNCQRCHINSGECNLCSEQLYGSTCSERCSDGCDAQSCDMQGVCRLGCVQGQMGETCQISTMSMILPVGLTTVLSTLLVMIILFVRRSSVCRRHPKISDTVDHGDTELMKLTEMTSIADRKNSLPLLRASAYVDRSSVTTRIPLCHFKKYVSIQKLNEGLIKQFYRLPINPVYPCYEGDLTRSAVKNRYGNILPYDYNRVVLVKDSVGLTSDYTNASFIEGYNTGRSFIATQGPFPEVFNAFWQMIWQQDVSKIVMLTNCVENRRHKCGQYWPEMGPSQAISPNTTVECVTEQIEGYFTVRTLSLKKAGHTPRLVIQFHFTSWPDHSVPTNVTSLLNLHKLVTSSTASTDGPVVVHCSAGVGRTGTYIAMDYVIQQAKAEGLVDVFDCVLRLRHQRLNMVQTEEQYILLHDLLLQALDSLREMGCSSTLMLGTHREEEET